MLGPSTVASVMNRSNDSRSAGRVPKRRYKAGTTNQVSTVEVINPPMTTTAIGCTTSKPAIPSRKSNGRNRAPTATAVVSGRGQPFPCRSEDEIHAEGFLAGILELLGAPDEQHGAADCQPEDAEQAGDRADRDRSTVDERTERRPARAPGRARNRTDASFQLEKAACISRKIPSAIARSTPMNVVRDACIIAIVTEKFGVIFDREVARSESIRDVVRDIVEAAAAHIDTDVHVSGHGLVANHVRALRQSYVGDFVERYLSGSVGKVDLQSPNGVEAVAGLGRAPDHDLEDLLFLEQAPDLDAGEDRCGGAPHVSRLDPPRLSLGQVDLDLGGLLDHGEFDLRRFDAVDLMPLRRLIRPYRTVIPARPTPSPRQTRPAGTLPGRY